MKLLIFFVGDGKMSYVDLVGLPVRNCLPVRIGWWIGSQGKSKEREFETETLPLLAVEITGQVPPFIAKTGVWAVIFREAECPFPGGL